MIIRKSRCKAAITYVLALISSRVKRSVLAEQENSEQRQSGDEISNLVTI